LKRIAGLLYSTAGFPGRVIDAVLELRYVLHAYLGQGNSAKYLPQEVSSGEFAHQYTGGLAGGVGRAEYEVSYAPLRPNYDESKLNAPAFKG
jgi:hypothetical protein